KPTNPPPSKTHTSSPAKSAPNPANSTSVHNSDSRAKAPPPCPPQPDLSQKLGKDGKLTSEECKRCFDLKLCMFCGGSGHMAKDCRKSTSKAAKAHAATISAPPDAKPSASASEETKLNASTLSDPNSLTPYYFYRKNQNQNLPVPPILLRLFDGTSNSHITEAIDLSVRFPTGDITSATFYVTPLDSACSLVLGHNWLTRYNPLIDWVLGSIMFQSIQQPVPTPPTSPPQPPESPPPVDSNRSDTLHFSDHKAPHIALINTAAFVLACRLEGSVQFSLHLRSEESKLRANSAEADPVDLSAVLPEYHDFADVFSKSKASRLAPHREHDLKIDLEEGASPPLGTIYSL
ncbi:hypothetical protein PAXRUDRAFT_22729, partial [Paxillus rubicundulus Ve08.2h10]